MSPEKLKMASTSRFQCVSSPLALDALLRKTRRVLLGSLALGLVGHVSLTQVGGLEAGRNVAEPLSTQFVKRQPRLTKPLELKKRPRPKARRVQRRMVPVEARPAWAESASGFAAGDVTRCLPGPRPHIGREVAVPHTKIEIPSLAENVTGARQTQQKIDTALELLDVDALDTGQYHAMIIQDPADKRSIRGFFHLAIVHIPSMEVASPLTCRASDAAIARLVQAVNEYTDIQGDIKYKCDFDSEEIFKTPWIYAGSYRLFELRERELVSLGRYLSSGGFFFTEEWITFKHPSFKPTERAFRNMFRDALATRGCKVERDWTWEQLPNNHPIFHCFFDFDRPPAGHMTFQVAQHAEYAQSGLFGAAIGDRVVGTFTHKCFVAAWYGAGWFGRGDTSQVPQQRRALQFGINTIVFALTQEGSITHQLMERVR